MMELQCPHCQTEYQLDPALAGRKVKCRFCQEKFRLPELGNSNAPRSVFHNNGSATTSFSSEKIETRCPRCLADYKLNAKYSGKLVRCRDCKVSFQVPNLTQNQPADQNYRLADHDDDDDLIDVTPPPAKTSPVRLTDKPDFTPVKKPKPRPKNEDLSESYSLLEDLDQGNDAADEGESGQFQEFHRNRAKTLRAQSAARSASTGSSRAQRSASSGGSEFLPVLKKIGSVSLVILMIVFRGLRSEHRRARLAEALNPRAAKAVQIDQAPPAPVSVNRSNVAPDQPQTSQPQISPPDSSQDPAIPADADDVTKGLALFGSRYTIRRLEGLKILQNADFQGQDAKILEALKPAFIQNQQQVVHQVIPLIGRCDLPEVPALLASRFKDSWLRPEIKPILLERKDPSVIPPLVDWFGYDTSLDIDDVLIAIGPPAEDAVLKLVNDLSHRLDKLGRLSNILAKIGSPKSIPALKKVSETIFTPVSTAAKNAISEIESRSRD